MHRQRPRLILHIGTHKTGTSALQVALHSAREALLHEHGVLYPDTQREPWPDLPKHCSAYHAAASGDAALQARERARLRAEFDASGAHTLLISEEGLSEPDEQLVHFWTPFAADFDLEAVCFLRRQDLFVEALFNQFVRERARRESRPLLAFMRAPATRLRLDYHGMLSRWAQQSFHVRAFDFDGANVRDAGLMQAFTSAIGCPTLGLPDRPANRSPDMRLVLLLNRMNRQRLPYELGPLLQAAQTTSPGDIGRLQHLLGSDERQRLLADCVQSNQRLAEDFGVAFADDRPVGEPLWTTEEVDIGYTMWLLSSVSKLPRRPS